MNALIRRFLIPIVFKLIIIGIEMRRLHLPIIGIEMRRLHLSIIDLEMRRLKLHIVML
jgi:hypothetical protein